MCDEARVRETKSQRYQDRSGLLMTQKCVRQSKSVSDDAAEIGSALFTLG